MSKFELIIINIVTICVTFLPVSFAQSPPVKDCPNAPKNLRDLRIELYYDGTTTADNIMISHICSEHHKFGAALTVDFKIGSYVGYDKDNKLVCHFYPNYDCTVLLQHACAAKMVSDFKKFVCCNTGSEKPLKTCLDEQKIDLKAVEDCVAGKNAKINPVQDILDNSKYLCKKAPEVIEYPASINNGDYDACTANQQFHHWKITVCKMYADPKPDTCKKI